MTLYIFPVVFALSAAACYWIAKKRGARAPFWVVVGALFGPLAIPFVLFAQPKHSR